MFFPIINYEEPLFRPPAEAHAAILQATIGCSWNQCAFCEMYTSKKFRVRPFEELRGEIASLARQYRGHTKKVFLADGNAFVLSAKKLTPLLHEINEQFGRLQRISAYALPADILAKSDQELASLRKLGLKLLYVGIETGDDELLRLVNKGETHQSTLDGLLKAQAAGIDTSLMIINGLGGRLYSKQHAERSADIINAINPRFLSTLTLSLPYGALHFQQRFRGTYVEQTHRELMQELRLLIENLDVNHVVFRSNHVSNTLLLEGNLSKDQALLLDQIDAAIKRA